MWVRLEAVTAWCVQETQQGLDAPKAGSKLWTESSQLPIHGGGLPEVPSEPQSCCQQQKHGLEVFRGW